jgi:hypothetical protein
MQMPFYSARAYVVIGVFDLLLLRLKKHLGHRTSRHSIFVIKSYLLKSPKSYGRSTIEVCECEEFSITSCWQALPILSISRKLCLHSLAGAFYSQRPQSKCRSVSACLFAIHFRAVPPISTKFGIMLNDLPEEALDTNPRKNRNSFLLIAWESCILAYWDFCVRS